MPKLKSLTVCLSVGAIAVSATAALADVGHGKKTKFGEPGVEHHVSRTIEVRMGEMYFEPSAIDVKAGETIRFVVINEGDAVHEFNIGTEENWVAHLGEMEKMIDQGMIDFDRIDHEKMRSMGMMHEDANAVLMEPGESREIIWQFPERATEVGVACNVPGHRESGMVGTIEFQVGS
ncbi:MAG: plastocyanin/azurin family copper-binding protein [Boseongicola sp.]|nr:plastocyanin/azurin family copper-binding protein [Boseongicola sp.]